VAGSLPPLCRVAAFGRADGHPRLETRACSIVVAAMEAPVLEHAMRPARRTTPEAVHCAP
jgi:hypothetical protein